MTPERYQRVKQVFLNALDHEPGRRVAFVAEACAGDPVLRGEVEELLRHHEAGGVPVAQAAPPEPGGAAPRSELSESDTRPTVRFVGGNGPAAPGGRNGEGSRARTDSRLIDHGRFYPGAVIGGRYRVVALLGRGGMGEVYRADDLKLGQPVALKFLPRKAAGRDGWLEGMLTEVRIARQVSHPSVCRVYDIGEEGGDPFLTMEYVDGETLDSLLSRIGRLPEKKAVQIAQELCAGLQAIHEQGILHRDLKPANVMIDGRGQVKVHDFGLAAGGELHGMEAAAGTPGYIAPEALAGREATVRSDVYALGLLLYELFTGLPAYPGGKGMDLVKEQERRDPPPPSRIMPDIDPQVEHVILACLERAPKDRPGSARQVGSMLPGGDPLAAALAAGETPSPEVVAASGRRGVLNPLTASLAMLLLVAGLLLVLDLAKDASLFRHAPLPKPPEVLADRAESILATLGYADKPAARAFGYDRYDEYLRELRYRSAASERGEDYGERLARARPAAIDFWYRQAAEPFAPAKPGGQITMYDPAQVAPGMIAVRLTPLGQLRELAAVDKRTIWLDPDENPATRDAAAQPAKEPQWGLVFEAAGLEMSKFKATAPARLPPVFADTRAAWVGVYPESPDEPVRIEAAALAGKIVAFRTVETNWLKTEIPREGEDWSGSRGLAMSMLLVVQVASMAGAAVLAWHNVRNRRGDRGGAARVACGLGVATALSVLLRADTFAGPEGTYQLLLWAAAAALATGAWFGVFYIAVEPYVRRVWPETVISWARLISGRVRDPLVGQSLLVGGLLGVFSTVLMYLDVLTPGWLGMTPAMPHVPDVMGVAALSGARQQLGMTFELVTRATQFGASFLLASVLLKLVLRRTWLTLLVYGVLQAAIWALMADTSRFTWGYFAVTATLCCLVLVRHGLLALMAAMFVYLVLTNFPVTLDGDVWYADTALYALLLVTGLAGYGAVMSVIGSARPAGRGGEV